MSERICVDPNIHFGKPCVAGTRIPVQAVLELVREGIQFSQIIADYFPALTVTDIQACIQFAIDTLSLEESSVNDVVVEYLRRWADDDAVQQARHDMTKRFAQPGWRFAVRASDDREQRNART